MIRRNDTNLPQIETRAAAAESPLSEYYRSLLQNLNCSPALADDPPRLVGVTSCTHGEGTTTIASNLARHSALDLEQRTLLIDLSESQKSISRLLGGRLAPGLSDVLLGDVEAAECMRTSAWTHLSILGIGSRQRELSASFDRKRLANTLSELRADFDFIVVDLPTATSLNGCFSFASVLDGVLLVVEAERVRTQVVLRAKQQLLKADGRVLGVVLNKRRQHIPDWLYRRL